MKHKTILIVLLVIISLFVSCSSKSDNDPSALDTEYMYEWISPDGVHYWVYTTGYKAAMVPRYDINGNLVIDRN